MATEILRPNADENVSLTPSTGTDNYANVDEVTKDDDTTYNSITGVEEGSDFYSLPSSSIGEGTINKVTIKAYWKATTTDDTFICLLGAFDVEFNPIFYVEGSSTASVANTYELFSQEYVTVLDSVLEEERAWRWADIDLGGLSVGFTLNNVSNTGTITQCWIEVDYTEAPAGPTTCTFYLEDNKLITISGADAGTYLILDNHANILINEEEYQIWPFDGINCLIDTEQRLHVSITER